MEKRQLEMMLDASPLATIYANRQGIIQFWNPAAEQLLGFSRSEALDRSLDIIIPERLRGAHWQGFENAMQSGHTTMPPGFVRTKAVKASGDPCYIDVSFSLIKNSAAQPIGSVAFAKPSEAR